MDIAIFDLAKEVVYYSLLPFPRNIYSFLTGDSYIYKYILNHWLIENTSSFIFLEMMILINKFHCSCFSFNKYLLALYHTLIVTFSIKKKVLNNSILIFLN